MDIICNNCKAKLKIADDKIPKDKAAKLTCPKCKAKITVEPKPPQTNESSEDAKASSPDFDFEYDYSDRFESSDKVFEFIEEEGKVALICESDPEVAGKIKSVLEFMEYHISEADSARDAIKRMRYHNYNIILLNEEFDSRNPDTNGILIYLSRLQMDVRRNLFTIMLSKRFKTMDHMMALNKSVNMIINLEHIDRIEDLLTHALSDHDIFYRVFQETLKNLGRD